MSAEKFYLGDGVYAELTRRASIVLTTENGLGITNSVVLEPEVYAGLLAFVARAMAERLKASGE